MLLGGELAGGESFPWWRDGLVVRDDPVDSHFHPGLRVVPNFSSGIVERAKRERALKSPYTRKGDMRRGVILTARSIIPEEKWGTTLSLFSPRLLPFSPTAEPGPRLS